MKLANRMDCLGSETAFAVSAEASVLEEEGFKIYPFHLGDINLQTPKTIRSAALEAMESGKTGYCPAPGIIELREALAEDVCTSRNVKYNSNNVSVQSGGKPVIGKFIMSKMNPGDIVLYPNPGYPIYESQIEFHGGIAHPYGYLDTEDGLVLDFDSIERGIEEGAKIIFYNNYNNPTGASSSISEMKKFFDSYNSVLVTHYQGLTVTQLDELRDEMRKKSIIFKITKNRITKLALKDTKCKDIADLFSGPTAIALSKDVNSSA